MAPFFIAEYAIKFQTVSQSVPEWLGLSRRWALVILSLIIFRKTADAGPLPLPLPKAVAFMEALSQPLGEALSEQLFHLRACSCKTRINIKHNFYRLLSIF